MADQQVTMSPEMLAQDKGPAIVAAVIAVSVISTLFVFARLFVRAAILKKMHLDDYLVISAVICGWLAVGFACAAVSSGNGRHFSTLTLDQKSGAILWTMVGFLPGILSFALPKFAVVALLCRIMNPSRIHRIFMWTMTSLCTISLLGCIIILFAQCTPSNSQWDFSVKGKCWNPWILVHYSMYAGGFSAVTDLYLAIYPAIVLAKLQLNIKKKIALSGALGIGSVATVVAIYKCTRLPGLTSPDFSYDTSDLVIWTCVEGSTIIIASCIPIMQPLVDLLFGKRALNGSSYQKYSDQRSGPMKSDIELSSSRNKRSRAARGNGSHLDDADSYENTMHAVDAKGSQETILRQGQDDVKIDSHPSNQPTYGRGIVRTDVFTVKYENAPEKTP